MFSEIRFVSFVLTSTSAWNDIAVAGFEQHVVERDSSVSDLVFHGFTMRGETEPAQNRALCGHSGPLTTDRRMDPRGVADPPVRTVATGQPGIMSSWGGTRFTRK